MERVKLQPHEWLTLIEAKARTLADDARNTSMMSNHEYIESDLARLQELVAAWKEARGEERPSVQWIDAHVMPWHKPAPASDAAS